MPRYKALKRRSMRVYGRMRLVAPGEVVELDAEQVKGFEDCFEAVPEEAPQATGEGSIPPLSSPAAPLLATPGESKEDHPEALPGVPEPAAEPPSPTPRRR